LNAWRWIESIFILLPVRLGLAAVFGTAAVLKLSDPQAFAFAVKAFKILDPETYDHILVLLAFGIPWAELIVSLLLVLGLWTRASATLLSVMLLAFTGGMLSLIARGIGTECACFGDQDFLCEGAVGWCHIGRNAIFLVACLLLVWRGGGKLALDSAGGSGRRAQVDPERDEG